MKARVIKNFGDKETGKFNLEGTEIECSLERAKELSKAGYIETLEPIIEKTIAKKELNNKTIEKKEIKKNVAKK